MDKFNISLKMSNNRFIIPLILLLLSISYSAKSQNIGINSTGATPDASAMLDIVSTNRGLLIPRVSLLSTTDGATILNPQTSLLVYNTNAGMTGGQIGFYYNSGSPGAPSWSLFLTSGASSSWLITGNGTTSASTSAIGVLANNNFIGTTNGQAFVMATNGYERMRITSAGKVGIGTLNPGNVGAALLELNGTASSLSGPHIQALTSSDNYPVFQDLNWAHDNISLNFDSYWDNTAWRTSSNTVNYQLYKLSGKLYFNYQTAAAAGTAVGFTSAMSISPTSVSIGYNGISLGNTYPLDVRGSLANPVIYGNNATASGTAIYGINSAASSTNNGVGVYGVTSQAYSSGVNGYGVAALNNNSNGTGLYAVGNNLGYNYNFLLSGSGAAMNGTNVGGFGYGSATSGWGLYGLASGSTSTGVVGSGNNYNPITMAAGSGGAFTGYTWGELAYNVSLGTSGAIYCYNGGVVARVDYYNGTQYKILGTGSVSTTVKNVNGEKVVLHCPETPEIYFEDYGQGKLVNGITHIDIDPTIVKNVIISESHPLRVFIQLEDNENCKGVVVKNKSATGFDVVEMNGGTSNTSFQWHIVCNRSDEDLGNGKISVNANQRFEPAPKDEQIIIDSKEGATKAPTIKVNQK